ncbi:Metallo-peptidase family M12B Reprolysin-like-domain-containing protein [Entophlyctis helioformis]|nr:Metallo-peptidase family M12B Reprolysin-like-domain-containing protein [Entophlyctis helioformis]
MAITRLLHLLLLHLLLLLPSPSAAAPLDASDHALPDPPLWIAQNAAQPKPIRTYDFIGSHKVVRLSRDIVHLSFSAYNQSFELELAPNFQLVHPNAIVEIHNPADDSIEPLTLPISPHSVFDGKVLKTGYDGRKFSDGWARITFDSSNVHDRDATFDGVINTSEGMFHVKRIDHYRKAKRDVDIEIASPYSREPENWRSKLMIFRDEQESAITQRWGPVSSCLSSDPTNILSRRAFNASLPNVEAVSSCQLPDNTAAYEAYLARIQEEDANKLVARAPVGCPQSPKVLPMGVAADCTYVASYGSTSAALQAILSNWNSASKIYEATFNVQLAVVRVNLQQSCSANDPDLTWNRDCSAGYTITQRLSDFSNWRGNVQGSSDGIGLWHLMTKCSTQPSVGVAWLNMLCSQTATQQVSGGVTQFVSGTGVSSIVPMEWKVIAHEIGHNFGAYHDCTSNTCPCTGTPASCQCTPCSPTCDCKGQFLMHPLDNAASGAFSPSSISTICGQFPSIGRCLRDPGSLVSISSGICGNGVKEGNEQCDCGLASECANDPCCDGATCRFKGNARCDDKNDSCCSNCQVSNNGTVCHSSTGVCDRTVTCNGVNATCPFDTSVPDGTACKTASGVDAQCTSGVCTSRDLQCRATGFVNTVSACPAFSNECNLYCQDAGGICYLLNGNFLDGTTCGITGTCQKGKCSGGNPFAVVIQWIQMYPQYAIPIICIAALLILSILWGCVRRCCCRPTRKPPVTPPQPVVVRPPGQPGQGQQSGPSANPAYPAGNRPAPPYGQPSAPPMGSNWVDPAMYNGPMYAGANGQQTYAPPPAQPMQQQQQYSPNQQYQQYPPPQTYQQAPRTSYQPPSQYPTQGNQGSGYPRIVQNQN